VKTGHTRSAGYVLVGSASRAGASVVSVVLGTASEAARDADTLTLLNWGLDRFVRVRPVRSGRALRRVAVKYFDDRRVALEAARPVALTVRRGARVSTQLDVPSELEGPLPAGHRVGTAVVLVNGRPAARVPVVTAAAVPEASFTRRSGAAIGWAVAFVVLAVAVGVTVRYRAARSRRRGGVAT
jgi:serine-type D-Ala-D-Ala carboxypeptidase (penicillin-binding protein 5/6)